MQITRITGWLTGDDAPDGSLEMLLEVGDSVMSHRRRYSVAAGTQSAVDLLVLDPLNPRSALFQLTELRTQLETLPGGIRDGQLSVVAKAALQLQTRLIITEPQAITPAVLEDIADEIGLLASLIAMHYFT
ncbi:MAG: hypothetical protein EOP20_05070 [Hyphomicrobiales bacterium]|nr:MAG: hypothetical protein EOP20_05070 [Hyphomicrobiales bacterium]